MVPKTRRTFIVLFWLVLALAVLGAGTLLLPAQFVKGLCLCGTGEGRILGWPILSRAPILSEKEHELMKRKELTLVKSQKILNEVLKRDQIRGLQIVKDQRNPVEWLEKVIIVDYPDDGDILRISMYGADPKEMAVIVNSVVDMYCRESLQRSAVMIKADGMTNCKCSD